MNTSITKLALFVPAAFVLAVGCSTQKIYGENRNLLAASLASLESNDLQRAEAQATELLVNTGSVADDYTLQRFFANYVATRAHMQAFFGSPYLTEPVSGAWAGLGGQESRRSSRVAHLVATNYHGTYGLDSFPAARHADLVDDGEKLLPPELEELGAEGANLHIKLCLLTVYSRLQYQDQVNQVLRAIDGSTDLARLDEMLDRAEIGEAMRPWIYSAVFENLRRIDEKAAYKLAIRTLDAAVSSEAAFGERERRAIERWVTEDSSYTFRCPECPDAPVDVAYPLCTKCRNVDRIEFQAELR